MTTCTYTFANGDVVKGVPALKAYLVEHPELVEAKAEEAPAQAKQAAPAKLEGRRRDPTQVSMFNPYADGDIVRLADGQDWQVRMNMTDWYLTNTGNWRGTHPTIQGVKAMSDLIREVEQAAQSPAAAQPQQSPADANQNAADQGLAPKKPRSSSRPPAVDTPKALVKTLLKAGYPDARELSHNEARITLNRESPFPEQRFEVTVERRSSGEWVIPAYAVPDLTTEGQANALTQFRADLAALNAGKWPDKPQGVAMLSRASSSAPQSLAEVESSWDSQGIENALSEKDGIITLHKIIVPKGEREAGIGTKAMQELLAYADATGQQVALTPSGDFGGNKRRLNSFYRGLGFRTYKGFAVREKLIRDPANPDIRYSTGNTGARGTPIAEVRALARQIQRSYANLPKVHVLASPADLPAEAAGLRAEIARQGAENDVEGAMFDGAIYLFADNLASLERAEFVLAEHEVAHLGLRGFFGDNLEPVLRQIAVRNPKVREAAREAQKRGKLSLTAAVEEVLADMPTAELAKLKGWRKFVQTARDWFAGKGFERIAAKLDSLLQGAISEQEAADLYVAEVVKAARDWVKGGKGEAGKGAALSRGLPTSIEVDGKMRPTTNSSGKTGGAIPHDAPFPSGGIAYHGTAGEHATFDSSFAGSVSSGVGRGFWFTRSREYAWEYAENASGIRAKDPRIINARLTFKKPLVVRFDDKSRPVFNGKVQPWESNSDVMDYALSNGYDAIDWINGSFTDDPSITVFRPDQIEIQEDVSGPKESRAALFKKIEQLIQEFDKKTGYDSNWRRVSHPDRKSEYEGTPGYEIALEIRRLKDRLNNESIAPNSNGADGIRLSRAPAATPPSPPLTSPSQGALPVTVGQARQSAGWKALQPSLADSFVYELQNKQVDLKRTVEAIRAAVGKINEAYDAEQAEELYHARRAERIKDFLESEEKPLIEEMRMRGVSMPELEAYLWARTAKETNAHVASLENGMQDGGSGLTNQEVDDYFAGKDILDANGEVRVKGLDWSKRTRLDALAKRVDKIVKQNRQLLVDYQLESPETIKTWEQTYPHYVPLHRDGMENPLAGPGIGQGFSIKGSESKRRTGSAKDVVDILGNLMEQRARIISRGEKNRVAQSLYGLAKTNPNPEFWTTDRPAKEKVIERINGKDTVVERISPTWKNRAEVVVAKFLVNGKVEERAVVFEKRNPRALRMAEALKNLDADDLGHVLSVMAKGTRYFAAVNTQYNPIFGVINFLRDVQTGMLNLSSTPLNGHRRQILANLWPAVRGIASALRGNMSGDWAKLYEEFRLAGGVTGYTDMFATGSEHAKELQSLLTPTKWQSLSRSARENIVMRFLSAYNTTLENAVRLATYKAGLDNGLTPAKSASVAKNLTVNFNRKGRMATQVGAGYAFFNAAVQGMARMKETMFKDGKITSAGTKILAGGVMVGVGQSLLLAAAGFGDDEPPEFVRERNLILPIGDGKYLTAPMPLGFHAIPNIGRVTTEWMLDGFRDPVKHFAALGGVFADAFNPLGSSTMLQTLSPTVLDPVVAIGENQDWTGKNIAKLDRDSLNPTPGHTRAKDTASFLAKSISYALNIASGGTEYKAGFVSPTPDQLDYLAGQLGGGVWRELSKLEQTATAAVTGEDLPAYKIPLVGRFYGDSTGKSGQSAAFYAAIERINGHELELKGLRKDGRGAEAREYLRDNPEAMLVSAANAAENQLSELRRTKRDLLERGAEKTKVREVEERMTELMARFNARVKSAEERRKSAVALQDE